MQRTGLTEKVRQAAKRLEKFHVSAIPGELDIQTYREKRAIRYVIKDLQKSGELRRIGQGEYEYVHKNPKRSFLDIIWHLVRSHRQFKTSDIERLSGAARATVYDYLGCLKKHGYLKSKGRGTWMLVEDPGPKTPITLTKCSSRRKGG